MEFLIRPLLIILFWKEKGSQIKKLIMAGLGATILKLDLVSNLRWGLFLGVLGDVF